MQCWESFKHWLFWWLDRAQPWKSDCYRPKTTDKGNGFPSEGTFGVLKWLLGRICKRVCVHVCMCVGHFAMWSRCRTCRFISGSSCTLRRQFLDWLSVPSSNLVMLNRHLRLPVFYSLQLPHRKTLSLLLYVSLEQYVIFWVKRCSARI